MKISKKKMFALFALVSMLIVSAGVMTFSVNAAVKDRDVRAFISVAPKVIGVGQTATVNGWIHPSPSLTAFYAQAPDPATGHYPEYRNVIVSFTRPDGSKDSFMPTHPALGVAGATLPCGDIYFFYTPNQAGTWSVTLSFPGQTFVDTLLNETIYYKPSTSLPFTFTVTEEKQSGGLLDGSPWSPLPTGYWERPINIDNREWSAISGDWLQSNLAGGYNGLNTNYNPYSTAPQSAHIVWKREVANGGIVGGSWGSLSYPSGAAPPAIIINGKYYSNDLSTGTFSCYDIRTGEKLYTAAGTITLGQHLQTYGSAATAGYDITSEFVTNPILWQFASGVWRRYEPLTGGLVQTITNVPTTIATGLDRGGVIDGDNAMYVGQRWGWNTTIPARWAGIYLVKWDYSKVTGNNWQTGVVWNVSLRQPDGRAPSDNVRGLEVRAFPKSNVVLAHAAMEDFMACYDMTTGQRLWIKDYGFQNIHFWGPMWNDDYGFVLAENIVANRLVAFDVKTGNKLWETDPPFDDPWDGQWPTGVTAGDKFYIYTTGGNVRAYESATGKQVWKTYIGNTTETIYGTWPSFHIPYAAGNLQNVAGADKTLFIATGISWGAQPYSRFHRMRAFDMDTGDLLWSISGIWSGQAIADGYLVATNSADGTLYTFGKGKTETAVSIQNDVIANGGSALIKGTVMDMSPAQPNTPAVAKESMTEWMDYLHMQNATTLNNPPTPKGVPIQLFAVDPNGNIQDIGTVTTDSLGHYEIGWAPSIEGAYKILANFAGDDSYWSSSTETALLVTAAPQTNGGTEQPVAAAPDYTLLLAVIAVVMIVIAILVVYQIVRKKQ